MTYVLVMVDKEGACSEVPASWEIAPGSMSFKSCEIQPSMYMKYWDLAGQLVGASQLREAVPEHARRESIRALVFPERKRLLAQAPDDLVDRIIEVGAVMIYEER
jgi:hypothetical protein